LNNLDPIEKEKRLSKLTNLQEIKLSEVDERAIYEEQNKDMEQIERDLKELSECFVDVAATVQMGGENLNQVEQNVKNAVVGVDMGTSELSKANIYLKKARVKMILIGVFIFIFLFCIVVWLGVCKGPHCPPQWKSLENFVFCMLKDQFENRNLHIFQSKDLKFCSVEIKQHLFFFKKFEII